jgi:hypothetical protein
MIRCIEFPRAPPEIGYGVTVLLTENSAATLESDKNTNPRGNSFLLIIHILIYRFIFLRAERFR